MSEKLDFIQKLKSRLGHIEKDSLYQKLMDAAQENLLYEEVFQNIVASLGGMPNCRLVQHGKRLVIEVILPDRQEALFVIERFAALVRVPPVNDHREDE